MHVAPFRRFLTKRKKLHPSLATLRFTLARTPGRLAAGAIGARQPRRDGPGGQSVDATMPARRCKKQHLEMVLVVTLCCLGRYRYRYPGPRRYRSTSRASIAARDLRYARLVDTPKRAPLRASIKRKQNKSCKLCSTSSRARAPRHAVAETLSAHERVAHRCDGVARRTTSERCATQSTMATLLRMGWDVVSQTPRARERGLKKTVNLATLQLRGEAFWCGGHRANGVTPMGEDNIYPIHSVFGLGGRGAPCVCSVYEHGPALDP